MRKYLFFYCIISISLFAEICEENYPDKINLFNFKNTNLEVIVKVESYLPNLDNLLDYYTQLEEYEICSTISDLIKYIKRNNNSKDL